LARRVEPLTGRERADLPEPTDPLDVHRVERWKYLIASLLENAVQRQRHLVLGQRHASTRSVNCRALPPPKFRCIDADRDQIAAQGTQSSGSRASGGVNELIATTFSP